MIRFPGLGIELESVGTSISILGFEISYFGILAGLAVLLGLVVVLAEAYYTRQNMESYLNLTLWLVVTSLLGARACYVLFYWEYYQEHQEEIYQIRQGGLWFYGALLAGLITIFFYSLIKKVSVGKILDTYSLGLIVVHFTTSLATFFSREYFGEYTDGRFAMQVPVDMVSVEMITDKMRQHIEVFGGERLIQVMPLFILELIWSFIMVVILICYHGRKTFEGELFLVYLASYGFGHFWIEWLRVDGIRLLETQIKVTQIVSAFVCVLSIVMLIYSWSQSDKARQKRTREREARKYSKRRKNSLYIK